jgi:diketogulonate reductase-like aldo/keto reductase
VSCLCPTSPAAAAPRTQSSNPGRIASNGAVYGWELSEAQMGALQGLECGFRYFISYLKVRKNVIKY